MFYISYCENWFIGHLFRSKILEIHGDFTLNIKYIKFLKEKRQIF